MAARDEPSQVPWTKSGLSSTYTSGYSGLKSTDSQIGRYGSSSSTYRPPPTSYRSPFSTGSTSTYPRDTSSSRDTSKSSYSRDLSASRDSKPSYSRDLSTGRDSKPSYSRDLSTGRDSKPSYSRDLSAGRDGYSRDVSTGRSRDLSSGREGRTYGSRDLSSNRDSKMSSSYDGSSSSSTNRGRDGSTASERLSLRDRYTAGTYPGRTGRRTSLSRSPEPVDDKPKYGSRVLGRSTSVKVKEPTPEPEDKHKPYSSSLSYSRLYSRPSIYSRSTSRDGGVESSSSTSTTPATTPVHAPTSLRFSSSTRYGSPMVRSPVSEKSPTVFGVGDRYSRTSSRTSAEPEDIVPKPKPATESETKKADVANDSEEDSDTEEEEVTQTTFVTVVTRGTSPTPPSTSSYLRSRRAEMARVIEKTVARPTSKPEMTDKEMQSDRGDDSTRYSRFGSTTRAAASSWSYLDRYGSRYSSRPGGYGSYSSRSTESKTTEPTKETESKTKDAESPSSRSSQVSSYASGRLANIAKVEETTKGNDSSTNPPLKKEDSGGTTPKKESSGTAEVKRVKSAKNLAPKQSTKAESAEQTEPALKSKSSSSSSLPADTPPSAASLTTNQVKQDSTDSKNCKLPPSVPKSEAPNAVKPSASTSKFGAANKDFRKSSLNVELTNALQAEAFREMQEKQRMAGKQKNIRRTSSAGTSEGEAKSEKRGSAPSLSTTGTGPLKVSKSLSKMQSTSSSSVCSNDEKKSPSKSKSKVDVNQTESRSHSRHSTVTTSSSSSSEASSSGSETSSSSENSSDEEDSVSRSSGVNVKLPPGDPASAASGKPASSADESSMSADKPPRPPAMPKPPPKPEDTKSLIMRGLESVTSLFRGRAAEPGDTGSCDNLTKADSTHSLNKLEHEDGKKSGGETKKKKHKIRHIESGERAWWLDSNPNIPEGIQRIQSSKSISKMSDSDKESNKSEKQRKINYKLKKQDSADKAWWLDSNANIPDGIQKIKSGASLNRQDSDQDSQKSGDSKRSVQKTKSSSSVSKDSDQDSKKSGISKKGKVRNYKICHQESGEKSSGLGSSDNVPESIQRVRSSHSVNNVKEQVGSKEGEISKYKLRHQQSGEQAWWLNSNANIPEGILKLQSNKSLADFLKQEAKIKRQTSSSEDSSEESSEEEDHEVQKQNRKNAKDGNVVPKFPLTLPLSESSVTSNVEVQKTEEDSGRQSPYDNLQGQQTEGTGGNRSKAAKQRRARPKNLPLFISNHTNIDDILGSAATLVDPALGLSRLRKAQTGGRQDSGDEDNEEGGGGLEVDVDQVKVHDSTPQKPRIRHLGAASEEMKRKQSEGLIKLDDAALQLYKDGDYGAYLDLEACINEQQEEFDGFQTNRKNAIVLRTQLSVRVHTIIEKLLNSEGRELRRALFSLKQIFQEDKDLVHEFVQNDGLACLIKVGSQADQNYQNYILRALGQVMLYVDGMNGVMEHGETLQWLYALIASKFRLVVKTALKLLLVFVEYVESNCLLLIRAVRAVDVAQGRPPWSHIMRLLRDYDAADTELLIYATTLLNKTLNGLPDQDTYYDQVDALEEQGMEGAIQRYMSKQGTDLDLLRQFQIYEAVLHHEDGEEKGTPLRQLDEAVRKTLRHRKSTGGSVERRRSRRHSTGTSPLALALSAPAARPTPTDDDSESSSSRSSPAPGDPNGGYRECKAGEAGVTPALRRRRERAERQRSFIREQQETAATLRVSLGATEGAEDDKQKVANGVLDGSELQMSNKLNRASSRKDMTPLMNAVNKRDSAENEAKSPDGILKKPWVLSMMYGKNEGVEGEDGVAENEKEDDSERKVILQIKRENTVKDLTQKLANQNILNSPVDEGSNKVITRIGDMTGLISKAKEGLAKSKSKGDVQKSPTGENIPKLETKKSETELHWEELVQSLNRPLSLCDLDFTDLKSEDELDILSPAHVSNGGPPPPPPVPLSPRGGVAPPPPPQAPKFGSMIPPPLPSTMNGPLSIGDNVRNQRNGTTSSENGTSNRTPPTSPSKKTKKTVKLFWKEVRDDPIILAKLRKSGMIWDELQQVTVDTQKLEHLFESRAKELITKKQQEMNKNKEIIVLDHKRSNAINIGMTKLPPPRSIKTAILKMDATVMNREGIEKLLTMLPTEEERTKIQEAQMSNPDMPLGSAEQFLLTLASISELAARLKLWAFKLDYENSEKEIAEPLMDLKQGMETLKANKTFRGILSTLLSIGIFLNGTEVKGFQIEYLAKVPEVKDTVHKHSLLHHLCHMVLEKFPDATDLYSEIGAITRASKVDFDELAANIQHMEQECKASWDHLKVIAKHDGSTMMKVKMSDFLADCAERIIVLDIVHRRVMNRYHKFLLWLGIPLHRVQDMKPNELCRIISEFALEYRTTRERVLQQLEKKANHRERNKTRGKMITEVGKFRSKEDSADAELRQLLGGDLTEANTLHGTLPWRRQKKDLGRTVLSPLIRDESVNGHLTDGDDEILESLVKTATKSPATRTAPRERKRTRNTDRKSLKRSRTRENNTLEGGRESP